MNILSELREGACKEFSPESELQKIVQNSAKSNAHISIADKNASHSDHDQAAHTCHFGHCGHVILLTTVGLRGFPEVVIARRLVPENPIWRDLSPPLRPPIS